MTNRNPTSLAAMARGILAWAGERGIERARLLRAIHLDARALDAGDARIARDAHDALWRETARAVDDPAFGLTMAPSILSTSSFGVVGLLAMTSTTVGESLERASRFARVLKEDVAASVRVTERLVVVELRAREPLPRPVADASIAAFHHFMQAWSGETVRVREVFFRHERPASVAAYDAVFGCPVRFGQPIDAIVFDREVLDLPLVTAQPEVAAYLEHVARARLAELEAADEGRRDLPSAIRRAAREAVEAGDARVEVVAKRLGMSARTLQRALAEHGLVYRRVVDDAKWAIAAPLVASSELTFDEIAARLGYAETKAFRRAFRRWSGVAPSALRGGRR